jgi:hypothetical protein
MCDRPISVEELARVVPRHFLYIDISLSLCEGAENDCLAAENHSQGTLVLDVFFDRLL